MATFKELRDRILVDKSKFKYIFLTRSNLASGKCEIFYHLHILDMIISDAASISMSIPILFAPHHNYIKEMDENMTTKRIKHREKENSFYVDGDLPNNYSIESFDLKHCVENIEYLYVNRETLGFRLVASKLKTNHERHEFSNICYNDLDLLQ